MTSMLEALKLKVNNWRHERIPEIERPRCGVCKRTMYWHSGRQDWACKTCDAYNYWMSEAPYEEHCNEDESYYAPDIL